MKKQLSIIALILCAVLIFSACGEKPAEAPDANEPVAEGTSTEPQEFTFAHIFEPGHTLYIMAESFAEQIEAETDGRITINLVPAGALGGMDSNLEALSLGSVDITLAGESYTSTYYAPLSVSTAPYAFQSWEHFRAYADSDFFAELKEGYTEVTGNHIIGTFTSGFRSVTANKAVRTPADMVGLKIRVPDAPAFTAMPIACGASPTPMALSEVYLAIQQGVADAQENPLETTYNQKLHEVCQYICLTEHMMEPAHIVVSESLWNSLGEEDQALFSRIAESVSAEATDTAEASANDLLATFEELGNDVIYDVDKAAFAELCLDFNTSPDRNWSAEQWEAVQNLNPAA